MLQRLSSAHLQTPSHEYHRCIYIRYITYITTLLEILNRLNWTSYIIYQNFHPLQHIQNSPARAVVRAPKFSHINPSLKFLHWLIIKQRIDYIILSLILVYKLLTTTQPSYLYNLQPHRSTRSSDIITLFRPPSSSSLKVNDRSFRHASPYLWNQLPKELHVPTDHEDLSISSDLTHVSSSFPSSPLSPSITPSHLHSRLKTHLFHKSFPS